MQNFPADKTGAIVQNSQTTPPGEEVIADVKSKGYLVIATPNGVVRLICRGSGGFNGTIFKEKRYEIVNGCKILREYKDDSDVAGENFGKLLMRTKMYQDDKLIYSEEITKNSEDELDDALFTVPAIAKKVDKAEYDGARQKALRQGIAAIHAAAKAKAAADAAKN